MNQPVDEHHVTDAHIKGFGYVIFFFANLESYLLRAIAGLQGTDIQRSYLTTWKMSYRDRRDVLRVLVEYRELTDDLQKEFDCLITRLDAAYRIRNLIAHGVWGASEKPKTIIPHIMKTGGKVKISGFNLKEEEFTPKRLEKEAEKIKRLALDFMDFANQHLGAQDIPE